MKLRRYDPRDLQEIYQLFYDTVHTVNRADYAPDQLDAWAPAQMDLSRWEKSLGENTAWVAVEDGKIVGFSDLALGGYLDRLYVHKDYGRRGIASALVRELERIAAAQGCPSIRTEASITAKPFFLGRGYQVVVEQHKPLRGQIFINYVMEKRL